MGPNFCESRSACGPLVEEHRRLQAGGEDGRRHMAPVTNELYGGVVK